MKLNELKTIYICPDHNEKYHARKLHMDALLTSLGFKNFSHFKSGTENYPNCLCIATKTILENNIDEPILVLEDDIEHSESVLGNEEFPMDADVDAIYFGLSRCASHPREYKNVYFSTFEPYNNTQVRLLNMLSTHAILFISKAYKQAIIDALNNNKYNVTKMATDIEMSRLMPLYRVLANKKPAFFQSNKFNNPKPFNVERATQIYIDDDMKLECFWPDDE